MIVLISLILISLINKFSIFDSKLLTKVNFKLKFKISITSLIFSLEKFSCTCLTILFIYISLALKINTININSLLLFIKLKLKKIKSRDYFSFLSLLVFLLNLKFDIFSRTISRSNETSLNLF